MIDQCIQNLSSTYRSSLPYNDAYLSEGMDWRVSQFALLALGVLTYVGLRKLPRKNPIKPISPQIQWNPDGTFVANQVITHLNDVKWCLQAHRSTYEFQSERRPSNDSFFSCDPAHTKIFHRIARSIFSEAHLEVNLAMIRAEADNVIARELSDEFLDCSQMVKAYFFQVFTQLLFGRRGSYAEFRERYPEESGDFVYNEDMGRYLLSHLGVQTMYLTELFKRERLTEFQQCQFVAFLMAVGIGLTAQGIGSVMQRLIENPELEDQDLARVIIEDLRLNSGESVIERGRIHIILSQLAVDASIVGADPKTFNPQRLHKVPVAWSAVPGLPFGAGPHACPAWRFYKVLSIEFLTALIRG